MKSTMTFWQWYDNDGRDGDGAGDGDSYGDGCDDDAGSFCLPILHP